ncbi:hypothetical protein L7F22_043856 [Adiantum nelumboides]|nr:hypothetical protein [Adiantum nelumboides]
MSRSSAVSLSSIPTIAQLFKNGQLKSASANKLPTYSSVSDRISLYQGDITQLQVDAIVNAANETLLGGGGVDGAIHKAAGKDLLVECKTLNGCKTGDAKITKGYQLPASHVIHTVGPVYAKGRTEESKNALQSAYKRSLQEAIKSKLKTVAFPSISTGVYGYPIDDATDVAIETVGTFLNSKEGDSVSIKRGVLIDKN